MAIAVGAQAPVTYIPVYQVIAVECANCLQGAQANQKMIGEDAAAVALIGGAMHAGIVGQTKALCASPELTIITAVLFVDKRTLDKQAAVTEARQNQSKIIAP